MHETGIPFVCRSSQKKALAHREVSGRALPSHQQTPKHFNVFTVEEFDTDNGKTAKSWTKVGAAFPHKEGIGFSIELRVIPINGRLVVLPPDVDTDGPAAAVPTRPRR